ncbi:MAG TPA: phosphatase PAP2 family protein [Acidothermaceae bacterium]
MSGPPLLARRGVLAAIAVAAFGVMLVIGLRYSGTHGPGRLDRAIDIRIHNRLGYHPVLLQRVVNLANPGSAVAICAVLCVVFFLMARRRLAVLVVIGPALSGVLVDVVLKPLFDRRLAGALSYPSGHTAAASSIALVVVVAMLGGSRMSWPAAVRWVVAACALAAAGLVAAALIAEGYHYTTDTFGGFLVAVTCVLGAALSIDALASRPHDESKGESTPQVDDALLPRVKA